MSCKANDPNFPFVANALPLPLQHLQGLQRKNGVAEFPPHAGVSTDSRPPALKNIQARAENYGTHALPCNACSSCKDNDNLVTLLDSWQSLSLQLRSAVAVRPVMTYPAHKVRQ
jgi:hypothetical protein